MFRKILAFALVVLSAVPNASVLADGASQMPDGYEKFIVTAYYSPLPGQAFYLRGSYEADKLLNGNGTHGASGRPVFAGMLAAPKTYAFGTRVELKGLGVGVVADRGGAIVPEGERGYDADRLDVWMGSGEEGLVRALTFGKRTVYGRVLPAEDPSSGSVIDLAALPMNRPAVVAQLAARAVLASSGSAAVASTSGAASTPKEIFIASHTEKESVFSVSLSRGSDPDKVKRLQEILAELGLYSGAIDGTYNGTLVNAVAAFQVGHGVMASAADPAAGVYGPKTRAALRAAYRQHLDRTWEAREEARAAETRAAAQKAKVHAYVVALGTPAYGETSPRVRELQKALKKLGYFDRADTAIFGNSTKAALIGYQTARGLIASGRDAGAGTFTPATRDALEFDLLVLVTAQG